MLALLLGIPIETTRENRQQEVDAAQIDTALLEQVDAGVYQAGLLCPSPAPRRGLSKGRRQGLMDNSDRDEKGLFPLRDQAAYRWSALFTQGRPEDGGTIRRSHRSLA
jgi:hypothetical protein